MKERRRTSRRGWGVGLIALATTSLSVLGGGTGTISAAEDKPAVLEDLKSVDQLRALFNEAAGKPRLILLLSPT